MSCEAALVVVLSIIAIFIAEIEDQLEPDADREHDFIDLDEIYSDTD